VLLAVAALVALALGPVLARTSVRLAARDPAARPSSPRIVLTTVLLALLLPGAVAVTGARPGLLALGWAAGAAVVLGAVDLAAHRLPDRVTGAAAVVCAASLVVDAAVTGSWDALVRAVLAALAAGGAAGLAWLLVPAGLGLGDVKLLALLGLVLGWLGWGVLLAGVFLGLLAGALAAVVLVAAGRAGWRTALPFGPPLLTGAVLAVALQTVGSLG
jgi:leader peptidase (prepilin peptidase)/N-methyltransferase